MSQPISVTAGHIEQNELFSKLYQIPFEPLQAFLYLKLSRRYPGKSRCSYQAEHFQAGMEIIDLTRILGILLDNAMEGAEKLEKPQIELKISKNGNQKIEVKIGHFSDFFLNFSSKTTISCV